MELSAVFANVSETPREKKTEQQLAIDAMEAKLNAEKEDHAWTKEKL